MTDRTEDLHRLLTMIKDVELTRLAELSAQKRDAVLAVKNLQLQCDRRSRHVQQLSVPDPAMLSGTDQYWQGWVESEAVRLVDREKDIELRQEVQRDVARTAFGRMQAFDKLRDSLRKFPSD